MEPGPFNFKLLKQLYGELDDNRRLEPGEPSSGGDIDDETLSAIDDVVAALETLSCEEFGKISSREVKILENNQGGEACEVPLRGGIQCRFESCWRNTGI